MIRASLYGTRVTCFKNHLILERGNRARLYTKTQPLTEAVGECFLERLEAILLSAPSSHLMRGISAQSGNLREFHKLCFVATRLAADAHCERLLLAALGIIPRVTPFQARKARLFRSRILPLSAEPESRSAEVSL
jgi:hypothetical protein